MKIRRDPIHRSTQGISPTAGDHVTTGPLDVAAIEQWDARNRRSRDAYALRQWQIRTNEMNADSKKKRKAVR